MKQVINGKRYNTETAKYIVSFDNDLTYSDLYFETATLYKKRTGEFFLAGAGGPKTRWAKECEDGSLMFGNRIIPLTESQAKEWVKEHFDIDTYVDVFFGDER